MRAQFLVQFGGKRSGGTGRAIRFDVFDFTHAGDGGAYIRITQNEAKGHFWHGAARGNQWLQGFGMSDAGFQICRDEVGAAPIAFGPFGL